MQVEGRRPVIEALRSSRRVKEVLVARGVRHSEAIDQIMSLADKRGIALKELPRRELDGRARSNNPQGVIAVVDEFAYAELDDLITAERPLVVALDGVTDPQNAGAIARSVEALGAHGLLLSERRSAGVGEAMERAAAGALTHLPVAQVPNLGRALKTLKDRGLWIVALDADGDTRIDDLALATEPFCLVVGSEGKGISRLVRERADTVVSIPLGGRVASLNASAAAAIAIFEMIRQR